MQAEDPTIAELLKPHGLRHRPVRQEPPRRPQRVPADGARLRRVLRQPLPPQRRGGAGERATTRRTRNSSGSARAACINDPQPCRTAAEDRGHRPADPQADGDGGRGDPRPLPRTSSSARPTADKPFFVLVQLHPDAYLHPRAGSLDRGKTGARTSTPTAWSSMTPWSASCSKQLDDLGIADNTIVIYTTDNGPRLQPGRMAAPRPSAARRTPTGKAATVCPA